MILQNNNIIWKITLVGQKPNLMGKQSQFQQDCINLKAGWSGHPTQYGWIIVHVLCSLQYKFGNKTMENLCFVQKRIHKLIIPNAQACYVNLVAVLVKMSILVISINKIQLISWINLHPLHSVFTLHTNMILEHSR